MINVPTTKESFIRNLTLREFRWLLYLVIVLAIAAWRYLPRPWHPTLLIETAHHRIYSTATRQQTDDTARALTFLYEAYSNRLGGVQGWQRDHAKLQVKLYIDRTEMRRVNPGMGWAEAFYSEPYCRAYYSDGEVNPFHWMIHESTHQLNHEVAHLKLAKWLEEGVAEYFSTSQIRSNGLAVGQIDLNTYPVWWMDQIATSSNLTDNIKNGSVIPLRAIITNHGGPSLDKEFNLYYLHWWTLTYFIFENPKYRDRAVSLVQQGGDLPAFEQLIGPVDQVQIEWYEFVQTLKAKLITQDRQNYKDRKNPRPFQS